MKRREYLAGATLAISALAGCSSSDAQADETVSIDEVKEQAEEISYEDLMRNEDEHIGKYLYYHAAKISAVSGDEDDGFSMNLQVNRKTTDYGSRTWENTVFAYWNGERFLEEDIVELWAQYKGLDTYENAVGAETTLPTLRVRDMRMLPQEMSMSVQNVEVKEPTLHGGDPDPRIEVEVSYFFQSGNTDDTIEKELFVDGDLLKTYSGDQKQIKTNATATLTGPIIGASKWESSDFEVEEGEEISHDLNVTVTMKAKREGEVIDREEMMGTVTVTVAGPRNYSAEYNFPS